MFPPPKMKKPTAPPPDLEAEGLDDLKGFAEDGMAQEMMARLGLLPEEAQGEQMPPEGEEPLPPVDDVPGMDAPSDEKAEGGEIDPELLKKLLASMA